ncbi:MAG: Flp family type IVb pilin [Planctomycetota bacterium]
MNNPTQPRRSRKGQGATEYVIILVLVAIGSISVITVFGDQLRELFNVGTQRLQGNTSTQVQQFDATADVQKSLNNF